MIANAAQAATILNFVLAEKELEPPDSKISDARFEIFKAGRTPLLV